MRQLYQIEDGLTSHVLKHYITEILGFSTTTEYAYAIQKIYVPEDSWFEIYSKTTAFFLRHKPEGKVEWMDNLERNHPYQRLVLASAKLKEDFSEAINRDMAMTTLNNIFNSQFLPTILTEKEGIILFERDIIDLDAASEAKKDALYLAFKTDGPENIILKTVQQYQAEFINGYQTCSYLLDSYIDEIQLIDYSNQHAKEKAIKYGK